MDWPCVEGERADAQRIEYHPGGNGLNVAINLAKLGGIDVSLYTAIVRGAHADLVQRACRFQNPRESQRDRLVLLSDTVSIHFPSVPQGMHTSLSVVKLDNAGLGNFAYAPGASEYLTSDFLSQHFENISFVDFVYITGVGALAGLRYEDLAAFLRRLREANSSLRVAADVILCSQATAEQEGIVQKVCTFLPYVDLFVPNEAEALQYSAQNSIDNAAHAFNKLIQGATIIKRGENGVNVYRKGEDQVENVAAYSAENVSNFRVADTVGAGDAWGAGFAASLVRDKEIRDACLVGNAVAARCIQQYGATTNTGEYEWIVDWIAQHADPGTFGLAD